jgi:hypothetical protein
VSGQERLSSFSLRERVGVRETGCTDHARFSAVPEWARSAPAASLTPALSRREREK